MDATYPFLKTEGTKLHLLPDFISQSALLTGCGTVRLRFNKISHEMSEEEKKDVSENCIQDIRSDQSLSLVDPAAEKKLLWKCDLHILPILMLLYLMSFMDRINVCSLANNKSVCFVTKETAARKDRKCQIAGP